MAKELAGKMGLGEYFAWESIEYLLDWQLKHLDTSLEEMTIGVKNYPRPYDDLYFRENELFFSLFGWMDLRAWYT